MEPHLIIDLPEHMPAEEAARILNAPGESYFLVQVLPIAGGHRAYLRRYKQIPPTKAETVKDKSEGVTDATAMSILRANRDEPVRTIVSLLKKAGVERGRHWVCDQLTATCAEDGREEEAAKYVKAYCGPTYTPKDVVGDLQYMFKIKRSLAWARQKLEENAAAVPGDKP